MQYLDDINGKRWRSGVIGKAYVVGMGVLLSVCACSVLASFTRSVAVVPSPTDFTPAALWTLVPTTEATAPASTATIAPTHTPPPPTAILAPTATITPAVPVRVAPIVPIVACPGGCDTPPDDTCNIKGNISISSGERIYHMPGQAFYDDTVISPEYGEKWFCTEDEAVEAGWRRAKR